MYSSTVQTVQYLCTVLKKKTLLKVINQIAQYHIKNKIC